MRRPPTLRAQLAVRYLAVLATLLLVSALFQYAALREFLVRAAADRLVADARAAVVSASRGGNAAMARAASDPHVAAWVVAPGGRVLAAAIPPGLPRGLPPAPSGPRAETILGGLLVARVPIGPPGGPSAARGATLVVATPVSAVDRVLYEELWLLVLGGGLALAVAGSVGLALIRRGLAPIERVARTADAVAQGDLACRAATDGMPEEVARLGRAFNAMLDRLGAALKEEQRGRAELRRFLADASHELRTPLTAVMGYLEVLQSGAGRDRRAQARGLAVAHAQTVRMARLVDQLLALSRLERQAGLHLERLELSAWLDAIWPETLAVAGEHPLGREDSVRAFVQADKDALGRALLNLVDNAAKYSPAGRPITVHLSSAAREARIVVRDHGPGIPPEERRRIFERFYRGATARARAAGTGLGLAIVQAAMEAQGGRAEVTDSVDGTAIALTLPLAPR